MKGQMKPTQKVEYFTMFESFPSTIVAARIYKVPQNKIENLAKWTRIEVGMLTLVGR